MPTFYGVSHSGVVHARWNNIPLLFEIGCVEVQGLKYPHSTMDRYVACLLEGKPVDCCLSTVSPIHVMMERLRV